MKENLAMIIMIVLAILFVIWYFSISPCDRLTRDITPRQLQECMEETK